MAQDRTFWLAQSHLPKTIVPVSYELAIDPNLVERTLGGNERVLLRFDTASKTLAFYAKQIRFGRITLDGSTPTRIELFDSIRGLYRLHFASAFSRGMHQLRITYVARLQNGSFLQEGMFLVHGPGHQSFFATQMEPVSARTVFPGWDEPLFKARFHISVVVPRDFTAISNMPVESERPSAPYRKIVTFKPTPPMSTYLVALCAGKYAHASIMAGKTRITLYAPPSDVWRALPALRNAREALLYDEHYFSLPYMMPKLDLVVVPGFQNAMENWGVITSGEQLMELDPKRPLQGQEFNIFSTVAHEIAHQWTGDLVTHDAWNDLWLTEGFAEWMQQRASRDLHPKWYQDSQGYFGRMFFLMRDRGREAIRPTGKDRWSISFSPTQYQKAANMIALIEHVVGPRRFRSQLTNYLIAHAYRNASTHDFFNAMNRASPRSLNFIEYPWLYQKGYARIEAIAQPCLNGRRRIILNQPSTQWWPVMLPNDTLVDRKMFTYTTGCAAEPLTDATSYFRVRYAPETLHAFAKSFGRLPSRSRDAIAGDAIAEFEQSPATPQIWQILPKLTLDDDPYLVRQVFWKGADLQSNAAGTSEADKVNEFLRIALGSLGRKILHSSRNDRQMQQSRDAVVATLGAAGDPEVRAFALQFLRSNPPLDRSPLDYYGPIFAAQGVAQHASDTERTEFLTRARSAPLANKLPWYVAYIRSQDPKDANSAILAIKELAKAQGGRLGPGYYLTVARVAPQAAWAALKEISRDEFGSTTTMDDIVSSFASSISDDDLETGLSKFYDTKQLKNLAESAARARMRRAKTYSEIKELVRSLLNLRRAAQHIRGH